MSVELNPNIIILDGGKRKIHTKASEEYVQVQFLYDDFTWEGWVPVEYRRTGVSIKSSEELNEYLNVVYEELNPKNFVGWKVAQDLFWLNKIRAGITKGFYDSLIKGGWQCAECTLPSNRNWASRIKDLKNFGYTLATDINKFCSKCKANKTHILLVPVARNGVGNGYETWSQALRRRILRVLSYIDVYESRKDPNNVLPDHKFSEIRWDKDTKADNPDDMSDDEIRKKFQLLTNQRNQQKREVCRNCYQTGTRGIIFGIPYFYEGNENWGEGIPRTGKEAEKGCIGCAWYDIAEWRKRLINKL